MQGKLIVIEAMDGSGKATQANFLFERLKNEGKKVMQVTFPDYNSPSSALVKMYLQGDFGKQANDVNSYVASTFYAVDRFASYKMHWQEFYLNGGIILADRYTTSNMVHQMVKCEEGAKREAFLEWLYDFEFVKFALPKPDKVLLLDVPIKISRELMLTRKAKTGGQTGDIHEKDFDYLEKCYEAYDYLVNKYGWQKIECSENGKLKSREAIHELIYAELKDIF